MWLFLDISNFQITEIIFQHHQIISWYKKMLTIDQEINSWYQAILGYHFSFFDIRKYFPTVGLTHWGRVTHVCVGNLTIIGSDNGLSPGRRQAISWTNAEILLIWPLGTTFSEIQIGIQAFSYKKMHLKMSSVKWRPFCLGLNVLRSIGHPISYISSLMVYHVCTKHKYFL